VYEVSEKIANRIPCFRRANFALINSLIACLDWSNLYLSTNLNEAVNIFYNILKRKSSSYPSSLKFENSAASTDQAIADLFAQFFQTTYSTSSPPDQSYPYVIPKSNILL